MSYPFLPSSRGAQEPARVPARLMETDYSRLDEIEPWLLHAAFGGNVLAGEERKLDPATAMRWNGQLVRGGFIDPRGTFTRSMGSGSQATGNDNPNTSPGGEMGGAMVKVGANVARSAFSAYTPSEVYGTLLEKGSANFVRNPFGIAAAAPSTPPTNWSWVSGSGFIITIDTTTPTAVENGVDLVNFRFAGTSTGTTNRFLYFETDTAIPCTQGVQVAVSAYARLVSGSLANFDFALRVREYNASGGVVAESNIGTLYSAASPLPGTLVRLGGGYTATHVDCATIRPCVVMLQRPGAIDAVVALGWPQLEKDRLYPTSPMLPANGTVGTGGISRNSDLLTFLFSDMGFHEAGTIIGRFHLLGLPTNTQPQVLFQIDRGNQNDRLHIRASGAGIYARSSVGGAALDNILLANYAGVTFPADIICALAWDQDGATAYLRGATPKDMAGKLDPTRTVVGSYAGGETMDGLVQSFTLLPGKLAAADVTERMSWL